MLKRLLFVLLLLGLSFGGIYYLKLRQQQQAAAMAGPPPPAAVSVAEVMVERRQPRLQAVGSVEATQGVAVTNEVAGLVREILFASGQSVSEGEVLLRLDDGADRADLKGLEAERDLALIRYRRLSKLVKERSVSQSDFDTARAELDSSRAKVESKRALVEKKTIKAPFTGLLGIRAVDLGEFLAPGSRIVSLQALDPVYVNFTLPERHFSKLTIGQPVRVEVAAWPGRVFEGEISAFDPGMDTRTRSLQIQASFANPRHLLRPGMFAKVEVLLPPRDGVLSIPLTAVTFNPYGDSVFLVLEEDGNPIAQRRQIRTGEVQDGRVEVLEGLAAGDRIVHAGQVKLRNGQTLSIDNRVVPADGAVAP